MRVVQVIASLSLMVACNTYLNEWLNWKAMKKLINMMKESLVPQGAMEIVDLTPNISLKWDGRYRARPLVLR
jgi:hypothetical protein